MTTRQAAPSRGPTTDQRWRGRARRDVLECAFIAQVGEQLAKKFDFTFGTVHAVADDKDPLVRFLQLRTHPTGARQAVGKSCTIQRHPGRSGHKNRKRPNAE